MPRPVVVRRDLVAGQRQAGRVEADADPRPDADASSTTGSPGHAPLDRDQILARADAGQVVVCATQTPPSALGGRARHQVGQQPRAGSGARRVVELLDLRPRTARPRSTPAASSATPSELLDQPRQLPPRHLEVRLRGREPGRIAQG